MKYDFAIPISLFDDFVFFRVVGGDDKGWRIIGPGFYEIALFGIRTYNRSAKFIFLYFG